MPWDDSEISYWRQQLDRIVQAVEKTTGPTTGPQAGPAGGSENEMSRFQYAVRRATDPIMRLGRGVIGVVQALLPLPTSFSQLVRQSVEGTTAMSTLRKSFDLVMLQIGSLFLPAIALAAVGLQRFAQILGEAAENARGAQGSIIGTWKKILKDLWTEMLPGGLGKKIRDAEREIEINRPPKEGWENRNARMFNELAEKIRGGEFGKVLAEHFTKHTNKEILAGRGLPKGLMAEFDKFGQEGLTAQMRIMAAQQEYRKDPRIFERARNLPAAGQQRQAALYDNPPGYQPQYLAVEDIRRQSQLRALATSPMDMERNKMLRKMNEDFVQWMNYFAKIFGKPMPAPGMK
jgi:hypothetical protein